MQMEHQNGRTETVRQTLFNVRNLTGDFFGGLTAMLVALPSAIAYGLIIYAPLGPAFTGQAAFSGILGTICLAFLAALFGGTPRLISAPCAPAAAVLSVFTASLIQEHGLSAGSVTVYIALVAFLAGLIQFAIGKIGGGKIIKYIPYPVVAGYLSGVGVLILIGQVPKFLGAPKGLNLFQAITDIGSWQWQSIGVGLVTMVTMLLAPKVIKKVPAAIIALVCGIGFYFILGIMDPHLLVLEHNKLVVGSIPMLDSSFFARLLENWGSVTQLGLQDIKILVIPVFTLAALLSIDTLKTCVVLDAMTQSRHNSNKELSGQGIANMAAGLLTGMPGAGTMGATIVNLNSGAKSAMSGIIAGIMALLAILFLGLFIAWIPIASLAGILIVLAVRMIDLHSLTLLKHRSTVFDFLVILGVVVAAVSTSLIIAAGVGIAMAIILFTREQMRTSVIRRKIAGNRIFSKKNRPTKEMNALEKYGHRTMLFDLQGQLFFGTTDQLFTEIEPYFKTSRFLILDMHRVQSLDYTAANMLKQIKRIIHNNGGIFILVSVPKSLPTGINIFKYVKTLGLTDDGESLKFFADLDSALEWTEDELIREMLPDNREESRPLHLSEFELFAGFTPAVLKEIEACLDEKKYLPDEYIFKKGDTSQEIYFIRRGNVKIMLPIPGGTRYRLATFNQGAFFGDMAFLDHETRSADAIADGIVELYILSRDKFNIITDKNPQVAGKFFEKLSFVISSRLRQSHAELTALQEI